MDVPAQKIAIERAHAYLHQAKEWMKQVYGEGDTWGQVHLHGPVNEVIQALEYELRSLEDGIAVG